MYSKSVRLEILYDYWFMAATMLYIDLKITYCIIISSTNRGIGMGQNAHFF
jgi:hypothetical protein